MLVCLSSVTAAYPKLTQHTFFNHMISLDLFNRELPIFYQHMICLLMFVFLLKETDLVVSFNDKQLLQLIWLSVIPF